LERGENAGTGWRILLHAHAQLGDPRGVAADCSPKSLSAGLPAPRGIPGIGRPPEVLEATIRGAGENTGWPRPRPCDIQESTAGLSPDRRHYGRRNFEIARLRKTRFLTIEDHAPVR